MKGLGCIRDQNARLSVLWAGQAGWRGADQGWPAWAITPGAGPKKLRSRRRQPCPRLGRAADLAAKPGRLVFSGSWPGARRGRVIEDAQAFPVQPAAFALHGYVQLHPHLHNHSVRHDIPSLAGELNESQVLGLNQGRSQGSGLTCASALSPLPLWQWQFLQFPLHLQAPCPWEAPWLRSGFFCSRDMSLPLSYAEIIFL